MEDVGMAVENRRHGAQSVGGENCGMQALCMDETLLKPRNGCPHHRRNPMAPIHSTKKISSYFPKKG
jgi:hypothetical protein